jgi:RimJ/RimL family protein N-acetyltransferase/GNAT superfamily N-acetyltransferase
MSSVVANLDAGTTFVDRSGRPIRYRFLRPTDDLEALTSFLHLGYADMGRRGLRFLATHQDVATTARRVAQGDTMLAFDGDRLVSTITLALRRQGDVPPLYLRQHVATFGQFAVHPDYRRRGIGAEQVRLAECVAAERGRRVMALDTAAPAVELQEMYTRRGYRAIGHHQWDDVNYRSVIMAKSLIRPQTVDTDRLRLRLWTTADSEPLTAMHATPQGFAHLSGTLDRDGCDAFVTRMMDQWASDGFCYWAVEIRGVTNFAGLAGLAVPRFEAAFTPCVEVGWTLAVPYRGRGYATEAARSAVRFGFDTLGLDEVVSFTVPENLESRRVMEKIGMTCDPHDDFDHPALPEGHPQRRHVLYRLRRG